MRQGLCPSHTAPGADPHRRSTAGNGKGEHAQCTRVYASATRVLTAPRRASEDGQGADTGHGMSFITCLVCPK